MIVEKIWEYIKVGAALIGLLPIAVVLAVGIVLHELIYGDKE